MQALSGQIQNVVGMINAAHGAAFLIHPAALYHQGRSVMTDAENADGILIFHLSDGRITSSLTMDMDLHVRGCVGKPDPVFDPVIHAIKQATLGTGQI